MALAHHHHQTDMPPKERNRCAAMFCLTWVGFFAAVAFITWAFHWF